MTRHLKGCYMDLLHAQFNSGRLSLAQVKTVLGVDFGTSWPLLQEKFIKDENGNYYNKKAEKEKERRVKFTESRRKNLNSPICDTHMDAHMEPHMETETKNEIGSEKTKEIAKKVWSDEIWREQVCMGNNLSSEHLRLWMAKFNASVMNDSIKNFSDKSYKKMFQGWVDLQKSKGVKVGSIENKTSDLQKL